MPLPSSTCWTSRPRWRVCAAGYEEDVTLSNLKLLLGALAVCIAAACNLLPAPFPSSLRLIQWSVALYLLCHLLLQALHLTLPRHCILITRQRRQLAAAAAAAASSASLDPVRRRALLRSARPSPLLSTTPAAAAALPAGALRHALLPDAGGAARRGQQGRAAAGHHALLRQRRSAAQGRVRAGGEAAAAAAGGEHEQAAVRRGVQQPRAEPHSAIHSSAQLSSARPSWQSVTAADCDVALCDSVTN